MENVKQLQQDQNEHRARLHRDKHARTCQSERKFVKYETLPSVSRWLAHRVDEIRITEAPGWHVPDWDPTTYLHGVISGVEDTKDPGMRSVFRRGWKRKSAKLVKVTEGTVSMQRVDLDSGEVLPAVGKRVCVDECKPLQNKVFVVCSKGTCWLSHDWSWPLLGMSCMVTPLNAKRYVILSVELGHPRRRGLKHSRI